MTQGFQQQDQSIYCNVLKTAPTQHQMGRKLETKPAVKPRLDETRTFKPR